MKTTEYIKKLKEMGACSSGIEWSKNYEDSQQAWEACERGDWLLWLISWKAGKSGSDSRKKLVLVACECARLAWKWMHDEGRTAIILTEKWANGDSSISRNDLRNAAANAAAYASIKVFYAANAAAYASIKAAYAANAAAYASIKAFYAAYAATYAAKAAYTAYAAKAASAAKNNTLKQCANIVRKHYPLNIIS